ncbi:hypothetical protein [Gordonia sp. DT101]|uniref:hypothetical protein n=1 Tax=Gordonia sp. DT101 TaxID=3416545 RepID=UPI003CEB3FE8
MSIAMMEILLLPPGRHQTLAAAETGDRMSIGQTPNERSATPVRIPTGLLIWECAPVATVASGAA